MRMRRKCQNKLHINVSMTSEHDMTYSNKIQHILHAMLPMVLKGYALVVEDGRRIGMYVVLQAKHKTEVCKLE